MKSLRQVAVAVAAVAVFAPVAIGPSVAASASTSSATVTDSATDMAFRTAATKRTYKGLDITRVTYQVTNGTFRAVVRVKNLTRDNWKPAADDQLLVVLKAPNGETTYVQACRCWGASALIGYDYKNKYGEGFQTEEDTAAAKPDYARDRIIYSAPVETLLWFYDTDPTTVRVKARHSNWSRDPSDTMVRQQDSLDMTRYGAPVSLV